MEIKIDFNTKVIAYRIKHYFRTELIYSLDEKLFYAVGRKNEKPKEWLSLEKGEDGKFKVYPFWCYEVKSGKREWVSRKNERAVLYRKLILND